MKLFPVIVLSCLMSTHAHAVDGWENLRWGASRKQVMEAYPSAREQVHPGESYSTLRLKSRPMAGYDFEVTFYLDKEQRLRGVAMIQHSEPAPVDRRMDDIERVLTERHGKPVEVGKGDARKLKWAGENGTISVKGMGVAPRVMMIIYVPTLKAEREPDPE